MSFGENVIAVRVISILLFCVITQYAICAPKPISAQDKAWFKAQQQHFAKISSQDLTWVNKKKTHQITQFTTNKLYLSRVKQTLSIANKMLSGESTTGKIHAPKSDLLIFISFSMPMQSLKEWMSQANQVHATLVLRGLDQNNFTLTLKKIHYLIQSKKAAIAIDPIWFKKFGIKMVPAVVVRNRGSFDVVYGDVSLPSALQIIGTQGQDTKAKAEKFLQLYRRKDA